MPWKQQISLFIQDHAKQTAIIFIIRNNYYYLRFNAFAKWKKHKQITEENVYGDILCESDIIDFLDCHFVRFCLVNFFFILFFWTKMKI